MQQSLFGDDEPVGNSSQPVFDDFYKLYPRKKSRQTAEKSFKRAKITWELLELIYNDIRRRLEQKEWVLSQEGMRYIPYPATYLNQCQWTDSDDEKFNQALIIHNSNVSITKIVERWTDRGWADELEQ